MSIVEREMKETTVLDRIGNIIDKNIKYESVYIEIRTKNDKFILEKEKPVKVIGFSDKK